MNLKETFCHKKREKFKEEGQKEEVEHCNLVWGMVVGLG